MVKVQRLFAKTNLKILIYRTDAQGKIIPCAIHKEGVFLKNEIVLFTDGDINIEVELSPELETVWLTQKQMGELFEVKQATLSEHINNIISSGELDETSIGFSDKSSSIGCDYAYDCRGKTRRKRYNGESCNEFFDNVVSS